MRRDTTIPIYLIAGFLDSGKTTFLRFTLDQEYFAIDGKTLLILCEEGEEEYDRKELARNNTVVEVIEKEEDFTTSRLQTLQLLHQPERVVMEYNGMWLVSKLEQMELPKGWEIEQQIVCADASTFQVYIQNMKSQFMDMTRNADMVIFNRSNPSLPLANYRRSIKAANASVEVVFENEDGEIDDIFQDTMPFDIDAPVIDILPEDYGIWFVDATDHPDRYEGKTVHFVGRAMKPRGMGSRMFVPGRRAMTCCAEDTTFLGYVCHSDYAANVKPGEWVDVTAKIAIEDSKQYRGPGVVLYAQDVHPCKALPEEMVYFN